jgi:hypothetical protein
MAISKKMLAIVAVLAVVVVVISAALALGGNGGAKDTGDNDDTPAARTAENSNMKVVVTDVLVGNATEAKGTETFLPLDAGEHFVTVKFDVTNKASADGSAPALFWELHASNGQIYSMDFNAESSYPDGLQAGATASYVLVYAVADGATPTKLVYDGITDLEIAL